MLFPSPVAHRERCSPGAECGRAAGRSSTSCTPTGSSTSRRLRWAILLDEGRYLGSMSTFYRLLRQASGTRERRSQAAHPATVNPELLAPEPNVAWSWDITQLRDPQTWLWFYFCEILDIYSRYVVGWMVASRESAPGADPADRCQARDLPRATDHPRRPWQPMRSIEVAGFTKIATSLVPVTSTRSILRRDEPWPSIAELPPRMRPFRITT